MGSVSLCYRPDVDLDPDEIYGVLRFTGIDVAALSNSAAAAPAAAGGAVSASEQQPYKDSSSTDHFAKHASNNALYEVSVYCPGLVDYAIDVLGTGGAAAQRTNQGTTNAITSVQYKTYNYGSPANGLKTKLQYNKDVFLNPLGLRHHVYLARFERDLTSYVGGDDVNRIYQNVNGANVRSYLDAIHLSTATVSAFATDGRGLPAFPDLLTTAASEVNFFQLTTAASPSSLRTTAVDTDAISTPIKTNSASSNVWVNANTGGVPTNKLLYSVKYTGATVATSGATVLDVATATGANAAKAGWLYLGQLFVDRGSNLAAAADIETSLKGWRVVPADTSITQTTVPTKVNSVAVAYSAEVAIASGPLAGQKVSPLTHFNANARTAAAALRSGAINYNAFVVKFEQDLDFAIDGTTPGAYTTPAAISDPDARTTVLWRVQGKINMFCTLVWERGIVWGNKWPVSFTIRRPSTGRYAEASLARVLPHIHSKT